MAGNLVLAVGLEPSRTSWVSMWHGNWVLRTSISREQSRSTWHFCKLDSEVTAHHFYHAVVWDSHKVQRGEEINSIIQGEGCQGHIMRRASGIGRYIISIFGKYDLPKSMWPHAIRKKYIRQPHTKCPQGYLTSLESSACVSVFGLNIHPWSSNFGRW